MAAPRFVKQLNEQIGSEFAAHQQYVACAVYYDALTMSRMARFFYREALGERNHAMMMVQYLLNAEEEIAIPGVAAPQSHFDDVVAPVQLALDQEKRLSKQIDELTTLAREDRDYASDQFMQWFIQEQVDEIATMSSLLAVVTRSQHDVESIEEWVAREVSAHNYDGAGPPIAGATA
jgi:ferritin